MKTATLDIQTLRQDSARGKRLLEERERQEELQARKDFKLQVDEGFKKEWDAVLAAIHSQKDLGEYVYDYPVLCTRFEVQDWSHRIMSRDGKPWVQTKGQCVEVKNSNLYKIHEFKTWRIYESTEVRYFDQTSKEIHLAYTIAMKISAKFLRAGLKVYFLEMEINLKDLGRTYPNYSHRFHFLRISWK